MSESHWELITSYTLHYQQALLQEIHTFINVFGKYKNHPTLNMANYFPMGVKGVSVNWRQINAKMAWEDKYTK